jgi:hypothetical protein
MAESTEAVAERLKAEGNELFKRASSRGCARLS